MKRIPFDWKNPTGYLLSTAAMLTCLNCASQCTASLMFLAVGAFIFAITFVKDMKCKLHTINEMVKDKKSRKHMYKELSEFIWTHANAKQLSAKDD